MPKKSTSKTRSVPAVNRAAAGSAFGGGPAPLMWDYQPEVWSDPQQCRIGDWLIDDFKPISALREVPIRSKKERAKLACLERGEIEAVALTPPRKFMRFRACMIRFPEPTIDDPCPKILWAKLKRETLLPVTRSVEIIDHLIVWIRIG